MRQAAKEPAWIAALRREVGRTSQKKAAKAIGYSESVVNQVLQGKYGGNLKKVETAVRGKLLMETVDCPVMGELRKDLCLRYQQRTFATTNHMRVMFFRACPLCPNLQPNGQANGKGGGDGSAS